MDSRRQSSYRSRIATSEMWAQHNLTEMLSTSAQQLWANNYVLQINLSSYHWTGDELIFRPAFRSENVREYLMNSRVTPPVHRKIIDTQRLCVLFIAGEIPFDTQQLNNIPTNIWAVTFAKFPVAPQTSSSLSTMFKTFRICPNRCEICYLGRLELILYLHSQTRGDWMEGSYLGKFLLWLLLSRSQSPPPWLH